MFYNAQDAAAQIDLRQVEAARQARRNVLHAILASAGSQFLSATWAKKSGEVVTRVYQTHAGFKLLSGDAASDSAKQAVATRKENNPHLVNVFDIKAEGWRSFNTDTVRRISCNGQIHTFDALAF